MTSNRKFFNINTILFLALVGLIVAVVYNHLDRKPPEELKKVPHLVLENRFGETSNVNRDRGSNSNKLKINKNYTNSLGPQKEPTSRAEKDLEESKRALDKFRTIARLQFDTPPDFIFKEVDADDYLIIKGSNNSGNHLTMMAGRVYGKESDIKPFIHEHLSLFSDRINPAQVSRLEKMQEYKNFNNSGDVVVMRSEFAGKMLFVGVMRRNDRQGSYMFLLEGNSELKDNTDRFEDVFENLRTK